MSQKEQNMQLYNQVQMDITISSYRNNHELSAKCILLYSLLINPEGNEKLIDELQQNIMSFFEGIESDGWKKSAYGVSYYPTGSVTFYLSQDAPESDGMIYLDSWEDDMDRANEIKQQALHDKVMKTIKEIRKWSPIKEFMHVHMNTSSPLNQYKYVDMVKMYNLSENADEHVKQSIKRNGIQTRDIIDSIQDAYEYAYSINMLPIDYTNEQSLVPSYNFLYEKLQNDDRTCWASYYHRALAQEYFYPHLEESKSILYNVFLEKRYVVPKIDIEEQIGYIEQVITKYKDNIDITKVLRKRGIIK